MFVDECHVTSVNQGLLSTTMEAEKRDPGNEVGESPNMAAAGRLALVTGGASGIGRAVCQALAREGASIVVTDLNDQGTQDTVDSLSKHVDSRHSNYSLDVTSGDEIRKVLEYIINGYRRPPCILVNSAGITRDDFLLTMDEEKFDKVIQVNLKGTFLMTQAVAKIMVDQGVANGAIVNLASIVGKVGNLGQVNYSASKAGVEGMTRTCAKELARFGVRCNAVLPGYIQTPMTDGVPDKVIEKYKKRIPLQRLGKPADVADVVTFLASDRSSYITGTSIEVTGWVFTSVGVVNRSAEPYDLVKSKFRSRKQNTDSPYDSVAYGPVKTALSESEAEAEE